MFRRSFPPKFLVKHHLNHLQTDLRIAQQNLQQERQLKLLVNRRLNHRQKAPPMFRRSFPPKFLVKHHLNHLQTDLRIAQQNLKQESQRKLLVNRRLNHRQKAPLMFRRSFPPKFLVKHPQTDLRVVQQILLQKVLRKCQAPHQHHYVMILAPLHFLLVVFLIDVILSKHKWILISFVIFQEDIVVGLFSLLNISVQRLVNLIVPQHILLQNTQPKIHHKIPVNHHQSQLLFVRPWQQKIMQNMKKKLKRFIEQFQDKMLLMVPILIGWMLLTLS
mmetsp:Transcript_32016/g.73655  ORF Transcript_32016/g.73655 Transcript_32016/m.73655 type:complete len:275 (-) Transcript_32016:1021-1845(-)